MTNTYILATQGDYNNPMVLNFSTKEERADYLKYNYKLYSVNTVFHLYNTFEEFFESPYYEYQLESLKNRYKINPNDDSFIMFKEELISALEESEFDASIYNIEELIMFKR